MSAVTRQDAASLDAQAAGDPQILQSGLVVMARAFDEASSRRLNDAVLGLVELLEAAGDAETSIVPERNVLPGRLYNTPDGGIIEGEVVGDIVTIQAEATDLATAEKIAAALESAVETSGEEPAPERPRLKFEILNRPDPWTEVEVDEWGTLWLGDHQGAEAVRLNPGDDVARGKGEAV